MLSPGQLCLALILLGLALCLTSTSVSSVILRTFVEDLIVLHYIFTLPVHLWCYIDKLQLFLLTLFSLPFSELSLVGLALDVVD